MFEVNCIDTNGEPVTTLTQWDINQSLIIEDSDFSVAPVFHFCNQNSERSLSVVSTMDEHGNVMVDIPNSLLREPYTIIAYIHLYNGKNSENNPRGKTVQIIEIPVRKKPRPTDLEDAHDTNVIYIEGVAAEVREIFTKVQTAETNVYNTQAEVEKTLSDTINVYELTLIVKNDITSLQEQADQTYQNIQSSEVRIEAIETNIIQIKNELLERLSTQRNIRSGTELPTVGSDGDVFLLHKQESQSQEE